MIRTIKTVFQGLRLLRHPELVRELGEIRLEQRLLNDLRSKHPSAKFERGLVVYGYAGERLSIGHNSKLCCGSILAFGDDHNGFGSVVIGANTWVGQYNNLRACAQGDIRIGDNCLISQFCTLIASNHGILRDKPIVEQPPAFDRLGVTIGNDVWLGAGTTVLPGVELGAGVVIGANSVVTRSVPAYEIWAGSPARKVRER